MREQVDDADALRNAYPRTVQMAAGGVLTTKTSRRHLREESRLR